MHAARPLTVCLVLGSTLLASCGVAQEPSSVSSPSALPTTVTPVASAGAEPPAESPTAPASPAPTPVPDIAWTEQVFEGVILSLVADGDRFVAVGFAEDAPQAAWVSADGITWERQEVPPPADVPVSAPLGQTAEDVARSSLMGSLVRFEDTVYAFGHYSLMDYIRPVGWRWTDGATWEAITSDSLFYREGSVRDVVAGDGLLVAARNAVTLSELSGDATVWAWSADTSWVKTDLSVADPEQVAVNHLSWNDGVYVAAGVAVPKEPDPEAVWPPRMWQSADGLAWEEVQPPSGDTAVCALEAEPSGGFIAMGVSADATMLWQWRDGDWSGVALPGSPGEPDRTGNSGAGCSIVSIGDRTAAILDTDDGTLAWWSFDGVAWSDREMTSGVRAGAVAIGSTLIQMAIEHGPTSSESRTIVRTGSIP